MRYWWIEYIACTYMTGLILITHFIHYPAFRLIKTDDFKSFVKTHGKMIAPIVFPAMLAELVFAVILFATEKTLRSNFNILSVLALWLITGLKSAKTHSKLISNGFSELLHLELMKWNQIRTVLWCLRFIFLSTIIWGELN